MPTLVVPRVVGKGEMEPATWSNTSTRRRRGIIHWETCKRRVTKVKMFTSFFLPCSQKATAKGEKGEGRWGKYVAKKFSKTPWTSSGC